MTLDAKYALAQIEHEIQFLRNGLEMLRYRMAPLQKEYDETAARLQQLLEERDSLQVKQMQAGDIDWSWLLEYMPETEAREQGCRQALERHGLGIAYFNPGTNQAVPQIRLIHDDPLSRARHLAGIEVILPYLKPDKGGAIVLPILGNEAVGRGTWELKINSREKSYLVSAHPLYRQRDHAFATLEEALVHIQENLYWCTADEIGG